MKYFPIIIFLFTLASCAPGLLFNPDPITKIINQNGTYVCSVNVTNSSQTEACSVNVDVSPDPLLKLVSSPNFSLGPLQTSTVQYQFTGDPNTICAGKASGCNFDTIRINGRWADGDSQDKVPVQWNPVTEGDCWVTDAGANDGNYQGELCDHPNHDNNTVTPANFPAIGDVYNPNDFAISVLVDNDVDPNTGQKPICISQAPAKTWDQIGPHSYYPYGSTIRGNFTGCAVQPGVIYVRSSSYTFTDGVTKYIAIKVDYLQ